MNSDLTRRGASPAVDEERWHDFGALGRPPGSKLHQAVERALVVIDFTPAGDAGNENHDELARDPFTLLAPGSEFGFEAASGRNQSNGAHPPPRFVLKPVGTAAEKLVRVPGSEASCRRRECSGQPITQ